MPAIEFHNQYTLAVEGFEFSKKNSLEIEVLSFRRDVLHFRLYGNGRKVGRLIEKLMATGLSVFINGRKVKLQSYNIINAPESETVVADSLVGAHVIEDCDN